MLEKRILSSSEGVALAGTVTTPFTSGSKPVQISQLRPREAGMNANCTACATGIGAGFDVWSKLSQWCSRISACSLSRIAWISRKTLW
ncbi:hypothetical protein R70199_02392 [Paraburkholderia domus]|nr:hypothetical protein R70199_02392 [Paraburkholderia domus]